MRAMNNSSDEMCLFFADQTHYFKYILYPVCYIYACGYATNLRLYEICFFFHPNFFFGFFFISAMFLHSQFDTF